MAHHAWQLAKNSHSKQRKARIKIDAQMGPEKDREVSFIFLWS